MAVGAAFRTDTQRIIGTESLDGRFLMNPTSLIATLAYAALLLASCTGSESRRAADVTEGVDSGGTSDPLVFCANAAPFTHSEFIKLSSVEVADNPLASRWFSALQGLPDHPLMFGDYYRALAVEDDVVTLAAAEGDQIGSVSLWRQGERWITFSTPSVRDCEVRVPLDDGLGYTDVHRDPVWTPAVSDTSIALVAYEPVCEPERDPSEIFTASLVETEDDVTMHVFSALPSGSARCGGRRPIPLTLALAAPLNGRQLLDGTHVPPKKIYRPGIELTGEPSSGERRSKLAGTPDHEGSPAESGDPSRVHTMLDE